MGSYLSVKESSRILGDACHSRGHVPLPFHGGVFPGWCFQIRAAFMSLAVTLAVTSSASDRSEHTMPTLRSFTSSSEEVELLGPFGTGSRLRSDDEGQWSLRHSREDTQMLAASGQRLQGKSQVSCCRSQFSQSESDLSLGYGIFSWGHSLPWGPNFS